MRLPILLCLGLGIFASDLNAQPTYNRIASDTIVIHQGFLNSSYLLNGKKLNPSVMQWFMSDYSEAYENIRISNISEQVSIASYSLGSIFMLTGFVTQDQNPRTSKELKLWGVLGLSSGIVFQVISGRYRRKAVDVYNDDIQAIYQASKRPVSWKVDFDSGNIRGLLSF